MLGHFHRVLEMGPKMSHNYMLYARVLYDLGNYYIKFGNEASEIEYHKRAFKIREDNTLFHPLLSSYLALGAIYKSNGNREEQFAYLRAALEVTEKVTPNFKVAQLHHELSEFYEQERDYESALRHSRLYQNLKEQLDNEQ